MDSSTMKTVILGKLPVARGEYDSTKIYYKFNIVTYYGSAFISTTDNNNNPPLVNASVDASGLIVSYDSLSEGWAFFANVIDGNIYAVTAGEYAKEMGDYAKEMGDDIAGLVTYDTIQPKLTVGEHALTENKGLVKLGINVNDASVSSQSAENRGQVLIGNNFTSAQPGVFVYTSSPKEEGQGEFDKLLTSSNKTSHCIVACDVSINNPEYTGNVGRHPNVILGANLFHTYGTNRQYGTLLGQYNADIDASVPDNGNYHVTFVLGAGFSSNNRFNPITIYQSRNNTDYTMLLDGSIMIRFDGEYKDIADSIKALEALIYEITGEITYDDIPSYSSEHAVKSSGIDASLFEARISYNTAVGNKTYLNKENVISSWTPFVTTYGELWYSEQISCEPGQKVVITWNDGDSSTGICEATYDPTTEDIVYVNPGEEYTLTKNRFYIISTYRPTNAHNNHVYRYVIYDNDSPIIDSSYIVSQFSSVDSSISKLDSSITAIDSSISKLDSSITAIDSSISSIEEDISALKSDNMTLQVIDSSITTSQFNLDVNTYYRFDVLIDSEVSFVLPEITVTDKLQKCILYFTTGNTANINFASLSPMDKFNGFEIDVNKTYEINAISNGSRWVLAHAEVTKIN